MWTATAFSVAHGSIQENFQFGNILCQVAVNVPSSLELKLASFSIRRYGPPVYASFSKWPPIQINSPSLLYLNYCCLYSTVIWIEAASTSHSLPHSWDRHCISNALLSLHRINRYFSMFLSLWNGQCFCNFDVFLNVVVPKNHWVAEFGYITILLNVAVQSF